MFYTLTPLIWNVHGLNDKARRASIRELIERSKCSIICIQELKSDCCLDDFCETAGSAYDVHVALDAESTRGGVLRRF